MTCDTWHVTRDTWHVKCDTWHIAHDIYGGWTFSQNFSSLALTVCDLWYYEDLEEKDEWLNQWINDEAVYRTAPATPGLLKIFWFWDAHLHLKIWEELLFILCFVSTNSTKILLLWNFFRKHWRMKNILLFGIALVDRVAIPGGRINSKRKNGLFLKKF